jgi:uncharacterized protein
MTERRDLPVGEFSAWLRRTRVVLREQHEADVPCGECSACCATSHFVHVGPEEARTLARIPRELLFPAPGLPAGNVLLGYDEQGRCPMLEDDGRCSIYEQRPLTCRTYDCRVFAAAGIATDRDPITRRARRWKFSHPTRDDCDQLVAVRSAARFVRERAERLPAAVPRDSVHVALLAIRVCEVFLEHGDESGATGRASSTTTSPRRSWMPTRGSRRRPTVDPRRRPT